MDSIKGSIGTAKTLSLEVLLASKHKDAMDLESIWVKRCLDPARITVENSAIMIMKDQHQLDQHQLNISVSEGVK